MRRVVSVLLVLMFLGDEWATEYATDHMFTPLSWLHWLFEPLPIKIRAFDLIMGVLLVIALGKKDAKGPRVRPMRNAMFLALGTIVTFFVYGVARGGDVRTASWQVYLELSALLAAFTVATICRTAEHYVALAKVAVGIGIYRAIMALVFYVTHVRGSWTYHPPMMTTHHDTVLWVVGIMLLLINVVESRDRRSATWAVAIIPLFLLAIQLNNRRLAWVSLVASLLIFYAAQRPSRAKRKILRIALSTVPVIGLYVLVGWGRPERIFKPLAAFASISTTEDASTKARNVENLGLIATSNAYGRFLGPGWGHPYIELSSKYSIREAFELWPFVPHNSVLGQFAFTGYFGFLGFWLMIPTAAFLHARTAKMAERSIDRAVGIAGLVQLAVCCNQMFGDMGTFSPTTMYMLATSFAAALRVPVEASVWVKPKSAARTSSAASALPAVPSDPKLPEAAWRS